ncbi:GNAT family N-acetyltransferase [Roseibium sp. RKSG952]|uniref:GNAT family N-acetyltransferase n=1 Tax=Roseibium sp. RKSG952 TaxID=2529384 RepID=UPI0012BB5099|nr:GNAT family N-acetyltransferase [Roseibium sp. RKSG952]MTH96325.1 GNAT family N-acetyltransferase [Roseibium sp. RKSG952]
MPYRISPASSADSHEIAALLRRSIIKLCVPDHGGDPEKYESWLENKTPENVEKWISGPGRMFVAQDTDRRILGVAMGSPDGHVLLNYVLPEARFSGVSRALLGAVEDYFRDCFVDVSCLKSTGTAERFYRARGYVETGEVDVRKDMSFRSFRKDL